MTERPELDAWLADADAVLDRNEYGQSWEADAMHACDGEAVEVTGFELSATIDDDDYRQALGFLSPDDARSGLGGRVLRDSSRRYR